MTLARAALLIVGFTSIFLSVLYGRGEPLIGLAASILVLTLALAMSPEGNAISGSIHVEYMRLRVGERLPVKLVMRNASPYRVYVFYRLELPGNLRVVEGHPEGRVTIDGGETLEESVILEALSRGHVEVGPLNVEYGDPLGIYKKRVCAASPVSVAILPRYMEPSTVEVRSMYTGAWPGSVRSRMKGRSLEFYAIRRYVPGDEYRRVNWRATAKRGRIMVNEYEDERVTDSVIIVDINGYSYETPYESEVVESVVSGAATMAATLLMQGNRVGLIIMGGRRIWIRPGFGKKHLLKILHGLAEAVPGKELSLSNVLALLVPLMLRRGTQVFIVTGLLDETLPRAVESLLAEGFGVVVIGVVRPFGSGDKAWRIALRLVEAEKMLVSSEVRRLCPIVIWDGVSRLPLAVGRTLRALRGVRLAPKR